MVKKINSYLDKKDFVRLLLLLFLVFFGNFFEIISIGSIPLLLGFIFDPGEIILKLPFVIQKFILSFELSQNYLIILFASMLLALFTIKNLYLFIINYFQVNFFKNLRIKNSNKLLSFYLSRPYSFFLNKNPSLMLRSLSSDLDLANFYIEAILNIARETLIIFLVFGLLLFVNISISSLVLLGIGSITYLIFFLFKKKLDYLSKVTFLERANQISIVNQIFGNIQDIKILLKEKFFFDKFKKNITVLKHAELFHSLFSKSPRLIFETLSIFTIVVIIYYYLLNNYELQNLVPLLALFAICALRLIPSFNIILQSLGVIKKSQVSFKSIIHELGTIQNEKKIIIYQNEEKRILDLNNLQLKDISFKYNNASKLILEDINITFKKNSVIGIIGKTGCGKSTLLKIILCLLAPTSGKILINNQDIKDDLELWYKNLSYAPQHIFLNDDTIKNNIAFGQDEDLIDEHKILNSVNLAELNEFVSSLPNKLDTKVGPQGIKLSGGQIQRIGIARAFYTQPNIFILDEATSSLDEVTEDKILKNFYKSKKDKLIIIVSHRLSSLNKCDEVYLLDNGKIKDSGKIEELIKRNPELNN